ncbi:hypothetical protein HanHA300_Chr03g0078631 [Helianthus annuus]|nr:hypothetical protein HanHA300_Chr03g0078631 [Helianthus annuus]KAJ0766932.1 hypothetical protein HanLR1_Chr03g0083281 [Helianthus annuus]
MASEELAKYILELGGTAYDSDRKNGYAESKAFSLEGKPDSDFELFKSDCAAYYRNKGKEFGTLEFGVLRALINNREKEWLWMSCAPC